MALYDLGQLFVEASAKQGRPMNKAPEYKGMMEAAGFEGVTETRFKWPTNDWPQDPHYKELGRWTHANLNHGLEGLTLALFTRGLNWSVEQTLAFCSIVRRQLRDTSVHAYCPM